MKKCLSSGRTNSPASASPKQLHALRKCLSELQALYVEAMTILDALLLSPATEVIRGLCARFRILQEYFAMRYHEARALAISALGSVEGALSFP